MKILSLSPIASAALLLAVFLTPASAVGDDVKKEVVSSYVAIAQHAYSDAHGQAVAMQKAIAAFTATPSEETHTKAKDAWIAARIPYLQTKVFRSSGGSTDLIDGWPVDETYIDYSLLNPHAGIIGDKDQALDKKTIVALNRKGGENNVSCGFHVIEFLLWGLDLREDQPGLRSFEDYIEEKNAAAPRRAQYLNICAELLVHHLAEANGKWQKGHVHNHPDKFNGLPVDKALEEILANIAATSAELSGAVAKAYKSRKQEDESSDFSDMTHLDLMYTAAGIANIVAGAYVGTDKQPKIQGKGLMALEGEDAETLKLGINKVMLSTTSFRPPFDMALPAPDDSPAREGLKKIETSLGELIVISKALAKELGVKGAR